MKTKYILFLSTILNFSFVFGQGTLTLTTDKTSYQYGDTIEVRLKIANNTDSLFTIVGSSSCIVGIHPPDIQVDRICTDDEIPFPFPVGSSRTWIWHLIPSVLGYPIKNGTQTIYGFGGGNEDSVLFTAPKYYGGMLSVSIKLDVPAGKIQSLRDSLGATILISDTLKSLNIISESWKIVGHSIDSIVTADSGDSRLLYIEADRLLAFDQVIVTSVPNRVNEPLNYSLSQNYPNPFNPTTNITFTIPTADHVRITIFDLTGRFVGVVVDKNFEAGSHIVTFNARSLASGTYLYHFKTSKYGQTKKMTVIK